MAKGEQHDKATIRAAAPIGLLVTMGLGWICGVLAAAGVLIGGLWLSPDLDTQSRSLRPPPALARVGGDAKRNASVLRASASRRHIRSMRCPVGCGVRAIATERV